MGVDPEDCRRVAMLIGYRLGVYNVIAFFKVSSFHSNIDEYCSEIAIFTSNNSGDEDLIVSQMLKCAFLGAPWGGGLEFNF